MLREIWEVGCWGMQVICYMTVVFYVASAAILYLLARCMQKKLSLRGKHVLLVGYPNELDSAIANECTMRGATITLLGVNKPELANIEDYLVSAA